MSMESTAVEAAERPGKAEQESGTGSVFEEIC